ncbi:MAG: holo-ACP synthase [Planctomycetes bacterium]|nr:holo-ACP synthase [Planctomycetota bacterium]
MIVSNGVDLVEIPRFARVLREWGERFEARIFTEGERAYCRRRAPAETHFAARFAAKEAVMKALGTGWRGGVTWKDIEVVRAPGGPPTVRLGGVCAGIARDRGIARLHLSLTHDAGIALAFVVAEEAGPGRPSP